METCNDLRSCELHGHVPWSSLFLHHFLLLGLKVGRMGHVERVALHVGEGLVAPHIAQLGDVDSQLLWVRTKCGVSS